MRETYHWKKKLLSLYLRSHRKQRKHLSICLFLSFLCPFFHHSWRMFSSADARLFSHSYKPAQAAACSNDLQLQDTFPDRLSQTGAKAVPYSTREVTVAMWGTSSSPKAEVCRYCLVDTWPHWHTGPSALGWCTIEMFHSFFPAKQDQNPLQFIYFRVYSRSISFSRRMFNSSEKCRQIIN